MYQTHFHLHDRPFSSAANPEHYFPAASIEQARESIARNVERSSCVTVVTGPVGSGKTLLCQLICNQYANELPVCVVQGESLQAPEDLLQSILHKLGLPFRGQDVGELRLVLSDHISSPGCVNGIIVIIDDADRLSAPLLDEVRAITNIVKEGQPCARVLLVGAPRLEENMASPELESLNQRIAGRLFLDNFSYQETLDYVQARITSSGGDARGLFTHEALEKVHSATHGVPRLVNQICDHALMLASINQADQLTPQLVEEAWADLQQLPMPSSNYTEVATSDEGDENKADDVIEFCTLEESSEDSELGEIEQTLTDLGAEASRAVRPIAVGGEIQFENEHHDVKPTFSNPVLPFRTPPSEGEDPESLEFQSEVDELGAAEPDSTQTFFFESPDEEAESEVAFDADSSESFSIDDATAESVNEAAFEFGDDIDSTDDEVSEAVFEFPETEEVAALSDAEDSPDAQFEDSDESDKSNHAIQLPEQYESHGLVLHDETSETDESNDADDEGDSIDVVLAEPSLLENSGRHDDDDAFAVAAEEPSMEFGEEQVFEETAEEAPAEEAPAEEPSPHFAPTMDQAANPFGADFEDEEIVIQQFVSPSQIARECYDPVTTAYSRQLSLQLAAAHPGLRMHPASEPDDSLEEADDEFQPLSSCIDDHGFMVADEPYSAQDDPVMPEEQSRVVESMEEVTEEFHDEAKEQHSNSVAMASIRVREDASLETVNASAVATVPKQKRKFRTLFSSMRGKKQ